MADIDRLDVQVGAPPEPGLIRSRIEAALTGRPSAPGPEQVLGQAVAAAVAAVPAGTGPAAPAGAAGAGDSGSGGPH